MRKFANRYLKPDGEKSATKKTLALSLATMFNSVLSLIMSMVLARVLTKTDLAAYNQTNMVLTTVFPFLQLGIPSGIYYLLARNQGRERAVVNEAMLCVTAGTLFFGLFLIFGGSRFLAEIFHNNQVEGYLLYVIPICLFMLLSSVAGTVMVYTNHISFSAKFHVFINLIRMVVLIVSMLVFRTVLATLQANSILQIIIGILTLYLVYGFMLPRDGSYMRFDSIGTLLKVSVPLGVASMVVTINSFLDKWIVSILCAPEEYAVFSAGAHEVPFITAITNSVMTVIIVSLTEAFRDGNSNEALRIIRNAAYKTSMLLMPIMMVCAALAGPIIRFIFTNQYDGAIPIFLVYLLYMPYWTIYYGPIMTAMGKPNAVLYCSLASLTCNVVISVLFVKLFGSIGASIATITTIYFVNLPINLLVICKNLHVKWTRILPIRHYLCCIALSVPGAIASYSVSFLIRHSGSFFQLVLGGIVFLIVTVPIYVCFFQLPWIIILQKIKKGGLNLNRHLSRIIRRIFV